MKTEKDADSTISQKLLFLTYPHEKPLEVWNVNLNTVAPSQRFQNLPLLLMLLSVKTQNNFHLMLAEGNGFYHPSLCCFYFIFKAQLVLLPFQCTSLAQFFSLLLRLGFIYHLDHHREISTSSPPREKHADVAESFTWGKMVLKHTRLWQVQGRVNCACGFSLSSHS